MRFMLIVKATRESEAGEMPSQELLTEMGKFNEELVKAGVLLAGEGLHPSSKGARVRFSGDKRTVIEDIEFDEDLDVDTVGGLLALELGRVPLPGAEVTWDGLQLRAEGGRDHRGRVRIGTVLVSPNAPEPEERHD